MSVDRSFISSAFAQPRISLEHDGSTCDIWRREAIVVAQIIGRFVGDFADSVISELDRAKRFGRVSAYYEVSRVHSYDIAVQQKYIVYGVKNAKDANNLFFHSDSLAMRIGIATVNLTYKGKLKLVEREEDFRVLLNEA